MRRFLGVALLVALPALAFAMPAEDQPPGPVAAARTDPRIDRARELATSDPVQAEAILLQFAVSDATADSNRRDQQAAAAKTALDVLPYERGNDVAAKIILDVLRKDHSHPDAWQLGYGLRRRVRDGLDVEHGEPFLREMIAIYPDYVRFRYALGDLLYGAGRPAAAYAVYEQIVREVPDDTRARYTQALLRELDGDAQGSLEIYDEIIARGLDLYAHRYKVKLLWDVLADYEGADRALVVAFAAVDAAPPGRQRDEIRAELEWDASLLESRREERAKLAEANSRTNRILYGLCVGWIVALGGGLALLRRRHLL